MASKLIDAISRTLPMDEGQELKQINQIIGVFVNKARQELKARWDQWHIDLSKNEFYEVVGALLARQVTLATQLAENPLIWNGHIAPLILRAMADVYISLAWILKEPIDRSRKFVLYGLGQEKLNLEHRKAQIEKRDPTPAEKIMIESSEAWINSQRFTFLTEVNLGSWSGISTRQMAEEAGCIDFYNYVYTPFSACSHSMWNHIARYNLRQCLNPLHQYHRCPYDPEMPVDPEYLYLAGKYLQKSFSTFDESVDMKIEGQSAFEILCEDLNQLNKVSDES
ncbi:MAG: hypothetical protein FJ135_11725 [Deltaproteobacteria bacterium]|nr:hypothetical protein [Deltaproteobacteria bacterium]